MRHILYLPLLVSPSHLHPLHSPTAIRPPSRYPPPSAYSPPFPETYSTTNAASPYKDPSSSLRPPPLSTPFHISTHHRERYPIRRPENTPLAGPRVHSDG